MSIFYSISYWLGFTPWERAGTHPPAARHIDALFAREEAGREPPFGRALDIGCGRGHWSVTLAERGWEVTGIDLVAKAIRAARECARDAGVNVTFIEGNVVLLREAGVGSDFRLFWDFGTIHGLNAGQRRAVGREITAIAAADATVLMLAWAPGHRGLLPDGMSRREVAEAFPGWQIMDVEPFDATGLPPPLRSVDPKIYRLQRI